MSDTFYRAFEDRYRGAREVITERLRAYLPFIVPLAALQRPARALDVGCGRGEWLELSASVGFDATGVDLDDGMLAECRARGLKVQTADAIDTLRALPDASLAMVTAFHVVEHIPFDAVRTLIAEALRVLQPGGLLILETPNPENLVVGASSFYRDPSHVRPLPPELLAFAAEHAGFPRHKVVRLQEPPALRDAPLVGLQQVLDGVSPDYSVVAQKGAPPEVLARFDAAFGASYGLALDQLAHRYDDQAARRRGAFDTVRAQGEQARAQIESVRAGLASLESHVIRNANQLSELGARTAQLEGRLIEADQTIADMLASRSWRVTAPLRYAGGLSIRLRAALRNGTLGASLAMRARHAAHRAGRAVLRNPSAKRAALRLLAHFPGLQARLREMMYQAPVTPGAPPPSGQQAADLSPRAQRLYAELKQAAENKDH